MKLDNPASLKKSVGAIHHVALDRQLSLVAKKLFNALLYVAHRQLREKDQHEVSLSELCACVGFNSHNLDVLKEALRALVTTRIEWNVLDDVGDEEWGVTTALAEAKVANGRCVYGYSPTLREKLANPHVYALINLQVQRRFTSTHAWSLYENLVRYRGVGRTPVIQLETLVRLLGLSGAKAYQSFKYLKRDVLTPAIQEINEKADVEVEMMPPVRQQRRVVAVQFLVRDKATPPSLDDGHDALRTRLEQFGIVGREAETAMQKHGEESLNSLLDGIEKRYRDGKIRRLREYTLTVLRESEGDPIAPMERDRLIGKQQHHIEAIEAEEERREQRARARRLRKSQEARLLEVERSLSESDSRALELAFLEHLQAEEPFVHEQYRIKGLESRLVRDRLHAFKVARLLEN